MTDRTARSATSPVQKAQHLTRRSLLAATMAGAVAPAWTFAQGADRPMRLVLPVSAGSGVDGVARVLGPSLGKALARPVVVENYPGAGGITGTTMIVKAPKDGSMLGMVSNNHAVNPSVFKNIPYHAVDDITPITLIGATPFVLVAHPSVAAKNVRELVALAKAQPGVLNYGSSGNGTILHLAAEMFVHEAQVDIKHIPYRGMGPLTADVLGGQIQMAFIAVAVAAPHVKSGALRAIGLSSTTRSPLLPEPANDCRTRPAQLRPGWLGGRGGAGRSAPGRSGPGLQRRAQRRGSTGSARGPAGAGLPAAKPRARCHGCVLPQRGGSHGQAGQAVRAETGLNAHVFIAVSALP